MVPPAESRKRKEREVVFHYNNNNRTTTEVTAKQKPSIPAAANKGAEPLINNRLLAGCMAYEFLTKGTLLGNMYNPAGRAVASAAGAKLEARGVKDPEQYGEVASILKTEGTHIPSIVNPTQLARWIQM